MAKYKFKEQTVSLLLPMEMMERYTAALTRRATSALVESGSNEAHAADAGYSLHATARCSDAPQPAAQVVDRPGRLFRCTHDPGAMDRSVQGWQSPREAIEALVDDGRRQGTNDIQLSTDGG